mmetsp:Transcript_70703/g.185379  ORF Transcript_70703/g.185379 Transcript_70703/m.185379 type:complete len:219 (-) Transcript_70703:316-972(-)
MSAMRLVLEANRLPERGGLQSLPPLPAGRGQGAQARQACDDARQPGHPKVGGYGDGDAGYDRLPRVLHAGRARACGLCAGQRRTYFRLGPAELTAAQDRGLSGGHAAVVAPAAAASYGQAAFAHRRAGSARGPSRAADGHPSGPAVDDGDECAAHHRGARPRRRCRAIAARLGPAAGDSEPRLCLALGWQLPALRLVLEARQLPERQRLPPLPPLPRG